MFMNMLPLKSMFSFSLVNVRLVFLFVAFVHLLVTAIVTLNIDTTVDEDPKVRAYYYVRWKLITCWFNMVSLAYLPTRIYCEWQTKQGDRRSRVKHLAHVADIVFTGILFPVVVFSDAIFWLIYNSDPAMLGPPRIFDYLPYWAQHSLHSVSLVVVLLDLVLTPREKPKNTKPRAALLLMFLFAYFYVILSNYLRGEMVYQVLEKMNSLHLTLIFLISTAIPLTLFSIEWVIIEFIWGRKSVKKVL